MQTRSRDQLAETRPWELQAGLSLSDYRSREVWQEEGYRSWREREEWEEGGQRGEEGTLERGEQRGAPSPGGDEAGGGRKMGWGSHGVDGVGTGFVHHTSSPSGCLAEVQGRGPAGVGAPHAKTN